jgi:chorismate dehydratase
VNLLRTLLRLDGLNVRLEAHPPDLEGLLGRFPAVLLIGDGALAEWYRVCGPISETTQMFRLPHQGRLAGGRPVMVTDLAMRWYELTGLPFVFAVWASQADNPPPLDVVLAMRRARRFGLGHLAQVASQEAARLRLPERIVQHYLWNFRYHLEAPDRAGLERFARLVSPEGSVGLSFWDV